VLEEETRLSTNVCTTVSNIVKTRKKFGGQICNPVGAFLDISSFDIAKIICC